MVDIVPNDAYSKFRQTQSPSFGTDKEVYSFYDSFSPGASGGQAGTFSGITNPFSTATPSAPQTVPNASQSVSESILQGTALATAGAALSAAMLKGGRTSMSPEPWFEDLMENAPSAPSLAPNLIKKGMKVIQKNAPKIQDATNLMNAQLTGSLDAAKGLGGQALQNAKILAAEFGSPGSVPGMLDFGAEMAGMQGEIPGLTAGALETELAVEAATELAAKNADIIAQESFAQLEANLATELASEVTPMELAGAFEQELALESQKLASEVGLEMEATQFQAVTDKAAEAALESISKVVPDLQLITGEAAHNAVGAGTTALAGTAISVPGAGVVSVEIAQAGAQLAQSIVGAGASAAAISSQTVATTAALAMAETELAVSVAAGGTQAILPAAAGAQAVGTSAAMTTFTAMAPMVIPALIMAIPMLLGKKGDGGRQSWNSKFRVGEDNKIGHEIQGVSKFDGRYAEMGEKWFIDIINSSIDAGDIVWDQGVIGPDNGGGLGDFGWQPGHGTAVNSAGADSPWFVNHDDLPRGYKGENPGTYFESEFEAAKMWLYVNAKAGYMKSGDLQKAFDAVDSFESLSVDRGYDDHKLSKDVERQRGTISYGMPDELEVRDTYEKGFRQVPGASGLTDKIIKLTPQELKEEKNLLGKALKWANSHKEALGSNKSLVVSESLDNYYVLQTTEMRDVGEGTQQFDIEPRLTPIHKKGPLNERGDRTNPPHRSSFVFLPDSAKTGTAAKAAPKAEPKAAPKPKPKPAPKKNYYGNNPKYGEVEPGASVYYLLDSPKDAASSGGMYKVGTGPRSDLPAGKWTPEERKNYAKYGSRTAPPPPKPKAAPVVPKHKAKAGDLASKAKVIKEQGQTVRVPEMRWGEIDHETGQRTKVKKKKIVVDGMKKGGKIGKTKDSKKKIPASGLELPVTGGKAKPNSMKDDVPRTARAGDFVINAKTVELMGVPFFRKLIHSAIAKANTKGMKVSKTSVSKKEGVDIMVQNGEIRIPRELVKIIGLKKLRAWNNTGLRARGESPIAA